MCFLALLEMFRVSLLLGFEESPVLPRSSELADRAR
jgi:hypothetical protein